MATQRPHLPSAHAQSPRSTQQTLSRGGWQTKSGPGGPDAQDAAEKGTDAGQTCTGTQPHAAPAPCTSVCGGLPPRRGLPDCPRWGVPRPGVPRPLSPDQQQPWDPDACVRRKSLQPRATPRATRGRRCLSTCSEDHKARQQRATPPAVPGGRPRAAGSWRQARCLILPVGQAGRHKRRSREGGKDRARRQTGKMDRPTDRTGGGQDTPPCPPLALKARLCLYGDPPGLPAPS